MSSDHDDPLAELDLEMVGVGALPVTPKRDSLSNISSPALKRKNSGRISSAKKRRTSPLVPTCSAVKMEQEELEAGEDHDQPGDDDNDEPSDDEGDEEKDCFGCARTIESPCWVNEEDKVVWALKGGRGRWCRECFTAWRLHFLPRASNWHP